MTYRNVLRTALVFGVTLLLSATAHAQLFRSYLASTGSDANPCTLATPCRLLPAALTAVADGGEIWMLDSANYNTGPVSVAKSVTILAVPGALGSVLAAGGNAMNISGSGIKVALRNLVIGPLPGGGGTNGVAMGSGASLSVEDCLIANLPGIGIVVNFTVNVQVTDSTIRDNGSHGLDFSQGVHAIVTRSTISGNNFFGVSVFAAGTPTTAEIADSTVSGNFAGVQLRSGNAAGVIKVSVHDSRIFQNSAEGVEAFADPGGTVTVSVSDNVIANNGTGIAADAGGKAWASGNTVVGNGTGLRQFGSGIFESVGNNAVRNNSTQTSGTIAVVAPK
jgi:hypothetical protein